MHPLLIACVVLLICASRVGAASDTDALLKIVVKNARAGDQKAIAPLKDLHTIKLAGDAVLSLIGDKKVGTGIKMRLAEIVRSWPAGDARKSLVDWLARHPGCTDDELFFFADSGLPELRSYFWNIVMQAKEPLSGLRDPERVAIAAKALGAFQDNPDVVVTRIGAMLDPANAHLIRACAAEALGGMHHAMAIQSLLPHLNDDAIGKSVQSSLYRLTGQAFGPDTDKWRAWLTEQGARIPWKSLSPTDYDNFLKLQKLLSPLDDPALNRDSFYGIEFRAKGALFILDVSGSMMEDDRIGRLKTQMGNLLIAMQNRSDKLRYGILTFGENIESCFPARGIDSNTASSHKRAVRFVEELQAGGGTPMCEALNHALNKMLPNGDIDAIYFLSDGAPSDGTPQYVLDIAMRIHQKFQIRIHTISIGEEPALNSGQPSLLNQIASACGGIFTIPP